MKLNVLSMYGSDSVANGYMDALRYLGCRVYDHHPRTKMEIRQLIRDHDINLILTRSKYGIRQLPIDTINERDVAVVVRALPMNDKHRVFGGPYEYADPFEGISLQAIRNKIIWTPICQDAWPIYMHGWLDAQIDLFHLPHAGNIFNALPDNLRPTTDVSTSSMGANRVVADMIIRRLHILKKTHCDCDYGHAMVTPNLHSVEHRAAKVYVNEACFMIPMYGGVQVIDLDIAKNYLGDYVDVATNSARLVMMIEEYMNNPELRLERIKTTVPYVAMHHSYLNRMCEIFKGLIMLDHAAEAEGAAERSGYKHTWEMNARLNAEKNGESYEPGSIAKID